jgi:transposase-like protein
MIKPIKESSIRTHQKFDPTFKREAVANWLSSGKSAAIIAQELGILPDRLYTWRKAFGPAEAGGRAPAGPKARGGGDLQAQLEAALRENRHLREQRDILKKTLGILSETPATATNGFTR